MRSSVWHPLKTESVSAWCMSATRHVLNAFSDHPLIYMYDRTTDGLLNYIIQILNNPFLGSHEKTTLKGGGGVAVHELWEGKAIFILQRALSLENCQVYRKCFERAVPCKAKGQQRLWTLYVIPGSGNGNAMIVQISNSTLLVGTSPQNEVFWFEPP